MLVPIKYVKLLNRRHQTRLLFTLKSYNINSGFLLFDGQNRSDYSGLLKLKMSNTRITHRI